MSIEGFYRETAYRHYKLSPAERLAESSDQQLSASWTRDVWYAAAMMVCLAMLLWTSSRLPQAQEFTGVCQPGRIMVDVDDHVLTLTLANQASSPVAVQRGLGDFAYLAELPPERDSCRGRSIGDQVTIKAIAR